MTTSRALADKQSDRQTNRQPDRGKTDKQTDRQTDRQTNIESWAKAVTEPPLPVEPVPPKLPTALAAMKTKT